MDERQVEELLKQVKHQIPVNSRLKEELRKSFTTAQVKRRPKYGWKRFVSAAAALLLLAGVVDLFVSKEGRVEAASLNIKDYVSYAELASGEAVGAAEYNDIVYLSVAGKGLFAYDRTGFHQLTDHQADELKMSPDGERLLWGYKGSIGMFNIGDQSWSVIKQGNSAVGYKQPSWVDDQSILYVEEDTKTTKDAAPKIMELQLGQQNAQELANGTFPSIVHNKSAIVFQKETVDGSQVVHLDLKSHHVQVIDNGREPSVSPHGQYIAYITTKTQTGIDNVWISDVDGHTKQAVTANISQKEAMEKGFFGVNGGDNAGDVSAQEGLYRFNLPAWSQDSTSIYMLKQRKDEPTANLTRIGLSKAALGPEQLVASFNEAMIYKNYDYAQSLLVDVSSSDLILGSNPYQIGYKITGSGTADGISYVDAEEQWVYTANPYIMTRNVRYNVVKDRTGYKIDSLKVMDKTVISQADDASIQREHGAVKEKLFTIGDIPKDLLPKGPSRIATLYTSSASSHLYFTVQALQDAESQQHSYVQLYDYDLTNKQFHRLDQTTTFDGAADVGIESMAISPSGQYAALMLFSDTTYRTDVILLDLHSNKQLLVSSLLKQTDIENVRVNYWNEGELYFTVITNGQSIRYKWDTVSESLQTL